MDPPMGGTFSNYRSLLIYPSWLSTFPWSCMCRLLFKLNHKRLWPF